MIRGTVSEILFSESQIQERVTELGAQISRDYEHKDLLILCLLKGSMVFLADIIRHISTPLRIDSMRASSYGDSTESSGNVRILQDTDMDISDKHVLIIEDIVDTGRTLAKTVELLKTRRPASLKICTFLDKPCRRKIHIDIEYSGYQIEDHFVVGYGLDFDEYYRNLPYIGILDLGQS